MPLVRIDLPEGRTASEKDAIGQAVQGALHDALGMPIDARFRIITEPGAGSLGVDPGYLGVGRSPAAIIIQVRLNCGRDAAQKQTFCRAVVAALKAEVGIDPADVIGPIELRPEDWSFGNGEAQLA